MAKRHVQSKSELLAHHKHEKMFTDAVWKVNLIITLIILNDKYDFDAEALNDFVDSYWEVLEYYNNSPKYQNLIEEWNQYFWDYAGIKIIDAIKRPMSQKPQSPIERPESHENGL